MSTFPEDIQGSLYVDQLRAMRDLLADRLDRAGTRDVAAIAKQLTDIMRELAELTIPEVADSVDEITQRRAARREAALGNATALPE